MESHLSVVGDGLFGPILTKIGARFGSNSTILSLEDLPSERPPVLATDFGPAFYRLWNKASATHWLARECKNPDALPGGK